MPQGQIAPLPHFSVPLSATLSPCSYLTPTTMSREKRRRKNYSQETREVGTQTGAKRDREEEGGKRKERRGGHRCLEGMLP